MTTPTELPKYSERVAIEESIATGWAVTKKRFLPIFLYSCLAAFLAFIPSVLGHIARDFIGTKILFALLLAVVSVVFVSVSTLGIVKMYVNFKRGLEFTFDDFLSVGNSLLNYLAAIFLTTLVIGVGFMFFIIPGVIIAVRLSQIDYFIVDRKMGPLQAMSASWTVTRGCVGMLMLFYGTMHLILTLGFLALVIGAIPAYMITMAARAQVYDRLVDTCPELGLAGIVVAPVAPALSPAVPDVAVSNMVAESAIPTDVAATSLEAASHAELIHAEPTLEAAPELTAETDLKPPSETANRPNLLPDNAGATPMKKSYALLFALTSIAVICVSAMPGARSENPGSLSLPQKAKIDETPAEIKPTSETKPHSTMLLDGGVTTQAEQVQWSSWHEAFDKAVIDNQSEFLKHTRAIRYGLAVIEYKVTRSRQLTARALPHDDPTYKKLAAEALSNYKLDALRRDLYLAPNEKFDTLVLKCYERLNNKKILTFPDNSERNEVSDVRWHIAGVGVGNYVHSRTDDYEQLNSQ